MELISLMSGLLGVGGIAAGASGLGFAWQMRRQARRSAAEIAALRNELAAEQHAASHDCLTGLPNRRAFYQRGIALATARAHEPLVAVVMDLDDFKQINDVYGHAAGDQVLIAVAKRFAACAGDDLVARLGGDEFAGLLRLPAVDGAALDQAASRLTEALAPPIQIVGGSVRVTASVGLAPLADCHLAEALRHADAAMYQVKSQRQCQRAMMLSDDPQRFHRPAVLSTRN